MNKITSINNLSIDFIKETFNLAGKFKNCWPERKKPGIGKTICLLFFEPSTRTKLSFEHAAKLLGFNVIDFSPLTSAIEKGESFEDTIETLVALKIDGLVVRHPKAGISKEIVKLLPDNIFFINAGDGNFEHPSQALLDVFTMKENVNDISKMKIAIIGDIKHSRVIPSQKALLELLECKEIRYVGPSELLLDSYKPFINKVDKGMFSDLDILYVLRIQKERFEENENINEDSYISEFQINKKFLEFTNFEGMLMHPGPVNIDMEITKEVAHSEQSLFLKQIENGLYIRMALLSLII